jgi:hypothetical protein
MCSSTTIFSVFAKFARSRPFATARKSNLPLPLLSSIVYAVPPPPNAQAPPGAWLPPIVKLSQLVIFEVRSNWPLLGQPRQPGPAHHLS